MFEGIAKTNTTNTQIMFDIGHITFEGIAKTNTTNTAKLRYAEAVCLRVLLKQIQQTHILENQKQNHV